LDGMSSSHAFKFASANDSPDGQSPFEGMAFMKYFPILLLFTFSICALAQEFLPVPFKAHPEPEDVMTILKDISITLNNIEEPATQLAASQWSFAHAQGLHQRIESLKSVANTWAVIMEKGHEMPAASDLFTIYSQFIDVQATCESLATAIRDSNKYGTVDLKNAKTIFDSLATAQSLPPALEPAVYDSILKVEQQRGRRARTTTRR